jgi:hypothetical protein
MSIPRTIIWNADAITLRHYHQSQLGFNYWVLEDVGPTVAEKVAWVESVVEEAECEGSMCAANHTNGKPEPIGYRLVEDQDGRERPMLFNYWVALDIDQNGIETAYVLCEDCVMQVDRREL